MPLPQKLDISIEYLMQQAFPQATKNAINFYVDALDLPVWENDLPWMQYVPEWMRNIWMRMSRRERSIAYIFASWMMMQEEDLAQKYITEAEMDFLRGG